MRTVKEISRLTGISVRTLHYYDEIGLLKPTDKSEAGYRLYDDKALEALQEILFFREFDISLKEIKAIMDNPQLDRNRILQMQRKMLVSKKERMERLIASIDNLLKGEDQMDFTVFGKEEIEDMYTSMVEHMSDEQKAIFISHYGSMEAFEEHFIKSASSEAAQKNFQKVVEWYGDKESALEASKNPGNSELLPAYQRRIEAILKKLAAKKGCDVHSFEVKEIIGEYDFVSKQLYQMKDVTKMMLELAEAYKTNRQIQEIQDSIYGEGTTTFFGEAIEAFYKPAASK
ncbi:MAG: MerR family transcriptional regulator [Acetatifactor sp.]|nr:MerR family transcriptional regulator [Acetatifactor sp.]